jgi:tetratricopeptide (TPR) repeat protein
MSIRVAIALAIAMGAAAAARPSAQDISPPDVHDWLDAVQQHRAGSADAAARRVAEWTDGDLERILPDVVAYLDRARNTEISDAKLQAPVTFGVNVAGRRDAPSNCTGCDISIRERSRLVRQTKSRVSTFIVERMPKPPPSGELNRFIIRAVLLHSDAAMRVPPPGGQLNTREMSRRPAPSANVLGMPGQVVFSGDGQFLGAGSTGAHWYLARALLHFVLPEPASHPLTKEWYRAAVPYFAVNSDFSQLLPHLQTADALFPNDATVAFDMGWRSEAHATPRLQADLRALIKAALTLPGWVGPPLRFERRLCGVRIPCDDQGHPYGMKPERESLLDAERHFKLAIARDPSMTEAYVRLARVLSLLGRHAEADKTLSALPPSGDAQVLFYAALIEGTVLEALDRLDEAAAAYDRARALFPTAVSANLASSALAARRGDTTAAVTHVQHAAAHRKDEDRADPFAVYSYGRGRDVQDVWAALLARLEAAR